MPKKRSHAASLPIVESNAAGIDVGATQIFVAVPADRDPESIRCFPTFTVDLERLADWLQECQIRTVAMESTGVYWIPLFQILEKRKIQVWLVNAHHVKNVPGRRRTLQIVNGFSTYTLAVCCTDRFGRMILSARSDPYGATAKILLSSQRSTYSTCRNHWIR